jgi:hypothetical protein
MFENLDDSSEPTPTSIDDVAARGRVLRFRRRSAIAGVAALTLVAAVSTVAIASASSSSPSKLRVEADNTTIANSAASNSTVPNTTVTADKPPTTDTTPTTDSTTASTTAPPSPGSTEPTITQTPHDPHDYSMLKYEYPGAAAHVTTGQTSVFTFTVVNNGSWDVQWDQPTCPYSVWGNQDYTWPSFAEKHGFAPGCATTPLTAAAHSSVPVTITFAGGYEQGGAFIPARPNGADFFYPVTAHANGNICNDPCLAVDVDDASPSPFELDLPAKVNATSGALTKVNFTIENRTDVAFSVVVLGPCVEGQTCTSHTPYGLPPSNTTTATITVAAHSTGHFVADVWATNDMTPTGTPLSPGDYQFSWSNSVIPLHVT